jgi:uncharacterized MAPEG superfamily protein
MNDLLVLSLAVVLGWVMVVTASTLRTRTWTFAGMLLALSNRDDLPEPSPLAARADRAARNMLENLLLFTAALTAARLAGAEPARLALGARVFFWARLAYFPAYLAGIRYLRTALWAVGVVGIGIIAMAAIDAAR